MILSQSPTTPIPSRAPADILDLRYPAGSRVALAIPGGEQFEILSKGFFAAGDPQVSSDGKSVFFCGKRRATDEWQIYRVTPGAAHAQALTSIRGGAMNPALLADERVVFVAPVPKLSSTNISRALYVTRAGEPCRRLSFTPSDLSEPTVLSDGRILFVEHRWGVQTQARDTYALLTINNDGTEVTQYAALPDPALALQQPRELTDGRIAVLVSGPEASATNEIRLISPARPYGAAESLGLTLGAIFSVAPAPEGNLFVCAASLPASSEGKHAIILHQAQTAGPALGPPLWSRPDWNTLDAVRKSPRVPPMGRISNVDPSEKTGLLLCLNANFTREKLPPASHVRVLAAEGGQARNIGELPLQADGSFMAEVPADVPLGFELLDEHAKTLLRLEPSIWVRPGENRSCIGCHEPPNQAPRNFRPLAVSVPAPNLCLTQRTLARAPDARPPR